MARLRLTAALCVLKIVHVGTYAEYVSNEQFQNVALIINVSHTASLVNKSPSVGYTKSIEQNCKTNEAIAF